MNFTIILFTILYNFMLMMTQIYDESHLLRILTEKCPVQVVVRLINVVIVQG